MTLRTLTAAALVGLAAMAAAGCGGASPASPPPQGTAPATGATGATAATGATGATAPATGTSAGTAHATQPGGTSAAGSTKCVDSPSSVVGQALGLPVGKVVASAAGPVTVCAYTGRYEVLVRYQTGENPRQFSLDRQSASRLRQSVTAVGGLGNEAFFASLKAAGSSSYTLAARKDNMAIFITSPVALGPERTLMIQLLDKA
jgi:hypothetical protein